MVRFPTPSTEHIAWTGFLLSISLNFSAINIFRGRTDSCARTSTDDSRFSRFRSLIHIFPSDLIFSGYHGEDYPHDLPLHVPLVALKIEDSERYGLSDFDANGD
jgi:hypothetical protein